MSILIVLLWLAAVAIAGFCFYVSEKSQDSDGVWFLFGFLLLIMAGIWALVAIYLSAVQMFNALPN